MDPRQVAKAGPSELTPPETSTRQRRFRILGKLLLGLFFLALIHKTLNHIFGDQNGLFWRWETQQNSSWQDEPSKGSQYILGVGKADITG
jgi:hypothetical protein